MPSTLNVGKTLAASGAQWLPERTSEYFPDPFMDMASLAMPETMQDALRWCEYIFMANNTYSQAMSRVISYFLTDVEITDDEASREEKDKVSEFLHDTLDIQNVLQQVAFDYICYGNSFTSILMPFKRYLSCPKCGFELPLRKVHNTPEFKFRWSDFDFHAYCPRCRHNGRWNHIDRRAGEEGDVRVKRWNPHEMELLWDPFRDETAYIWKIPEDYRRQIRKGTLYHLERANWEVIQAVKHNNHLLFDDGVIHHMKEQTLAGIYNRGWGISRVLSNFRQAWYVQVLHRYNEALALDYVIPFRLITPEARKGAGGAESMDPVLGTNLAGFRGQVERMLRARRRDPARWNVLPFPVQYQALGGDATQLAPKELLEQGIDTLLNGAGVPAEMYRGNLQTQTAPASLRLFEAHWSHLTHNMNGFVSFVIETVARLLSWEPVSARLTKVTHADDLNQQMAKLQLMMGRQISQSTGLKSVGMEFEEEQKQMLEEERFVAEQQQQMQEDMEGQAGMDMMAQGGGMPGAAPGGAMPGMPADPAAAGGAPAPAGGAPGGAAAAFSAAQPTQPNMPVTPQELLSKAQTVAEQIMGMPEAQKDSELIQLKKVDPTLHALVKQIMDDMRQQAQTAGGAQIMAQQFGKMGAASAARFNGVSLTRRARGLDI